jgi:hypothetical protein
LGSSEGGSKSNTLNTISEVTETEGSGSLSTKNSNSKPTILIEESSSCKHAHEVQGSATQPDELSIGAFDSFPSAEKQTAGSNTNPAKKLAKSMSLFEKEITQ